MAPTTTSTARTKSYRLIGYENRVMNNEDFENDEKDAGEIGAGQTITALYEIVLNDIPKEVNGKTTFVTFDFRYKKSLDAGSIPLQKTLTVAQINGDNTRSDDFYFAAGIAAYGMVLRESPYKGDATIDMARSLVEGHLGKDPHDYRAGLLQLMDK